MALRFLVLGVFVCVGWVDGRTDGWSFLLTPLMEATSSLPPTHSINPQRFYINYIPIFVMNTDASLMYKPIKTNGLQVF